MSGQGQWPTNIRLRKSKHGSMAAGAIDRYYLMEIVSGVVEFGWAGATMQKAVINKRHTK